MVDLRANLIRHAREAILETYDWQRKDQLSKLASEVREHFDLFTVSCCQEDLTNLVAAWTRLTLVLNHLPVKT